MEFRTVTETRTETVLQARQLASLDCLQKNVDGIENLELDAAAENPYLENDMHHGSESRDGVNRRQKRHRDLINNIPQQTSLYDQLRCRISDLVDEADDKLLSVIERVIDSLDDKGHLPAEARAELQATVTRERLDASVLNKAISIVQQLEPCGLAAADVTECLMLQIPPALPRNVRRVVVLLICGFLDEIAKTGWSAVTPQRLECSFEELAGARDILTAMNPFPGLGLVRTTRKAVARVKPDLVATVHGDQVTIKDAYRNSRLTLVRPEVHESVSGPFPENRSYLSEAETLVNYLTGRDSSLLRLGQWLAEQQVEFFIYGPGHLKPLLMRTAAEALGHHASTITRIVQDKYIQTDHGLFPIRQLFASDAEVDRQALEKVVANEDKSSPLSDKAIAEILSLRSGRKVTREKVKTMRGDLGLPNFRSRRVAPR